MRDCFQRFGFDVLLDKEGNPHLLEVNDKPAMGYDSVQPLTDTAADTADSSNRCCPAVDGSAAGLRLKAAGRECKCAAHPRVHVHRPCAVDLAVKTVSPVLLSTHTGRHGHTHTYTSAAAVTVTNPVERPNGPSSCCFLSRLAWVTRLRW